jgi:uncharacterized protein YdeI (YjbR/CyaY-like superfamily)
MATTIGTPGGTADKPAIFFSGPEEFGRWLAAHHDNAIELWMGLYKKHVANRGLTWEQAVPEALCWGWIDSRAERIDQDAIRQRWTPRKPSSNWSAINIAHVERLIAEGRMQPHGLAAFERRVPERTAIYAYEREVDELPEPYAVQLASDRAAAAFWASSAPSYRRICISWVTTAKQQATRDKRMTRLVEDSAAGRLIATQRYGEQPRWVKRAAAAAADARRA